MNDKVQEALERLEQGIANLLESGRWIEYLRFQARFHRYSFANTLLIIGQMPNATHVLGFHGWKDLGRYVRKGEHGIQIFAPLVKKNPKYQEPTEDESVEVTSKQPKKVVYGFRMVTVFDLSQTEGEPLPPTPEMPRRLDGDNEWYAKLVQACPFPVLEVSDLDGANGTFTFGTNQIRVLSELSETHKAKTLIHEWAHGLLHQKRGELSTEQRELEAESTAFVVASALAFDTSDYTFGYVTGWAGEDAVERLKQSGTRIQQAANQILKSLPLPEPHASDIKEAV